MRIAIVLDAALYEPDAPRDAADTIQVATDISEAIRASVFPLSSPLARSLQELSSRFDVIFNLIESFGLRSRLEPAVSLALERTGLLMTGSRARVLRLCLHKEDAQRALRGAGIPTPRSLVVRAPCKEISFPLPAIVKPSREDGSVGITPESVVYDARALAQRACFILEELKQPALIEEFIDGRELNLSLLETPEGFLLLPPAEMDFSGLPKGRPRIVSYDAKWTPGCEYYEKTARVFPKLWPNIEANLARLCRRVLSTLGITGYARIDLRLDAHGRPFVVDVNPNGDLGLDSGLVAAATQGGISYRQLLQTIVARARRFS